MVLLTMSDVFQVSRQESWLPLYKAWHVTSVGCCSSTPCLVDCTSVPLNRMVFTVSGRASSIHDPDPEFSR